MMYSAWKLNKQGDNIQPCHTPLPIWNESLLPCLILAVVSWPTYRFLRSQIRWSDTLISLRVFHSFCDPRVKGFSIVSEAVVDVFLKLPCFFYDPIMLRIWSLVLLPLQYPACTSASSQFMYCWSMTWRILNIILEERVQVYSSLNILSHCPSFELKWTLTFPSPVATGEFFFFFNLLIHQVQHFNSTVF